MSVARVVAQNREAQNNGLHQTGAQGVAFFPFAAGQSFRGAPAGEAGCSAGLEMRSIFNPHPL